MHSSLTQWCALDFAGLQVSDMDNLKIKAMPLIKIKFQLLEKKIHPQHLWQHSGLGWTCLCDNLALVVFTTIPTTGHPESTQIFASQN